MAAISSLGVGSGLDLGTLVSNLVEAERAPSANRLAVKEQNFNTELSAFGLLRSSLSQFQTSLQGLQSSTAFAAKDITLSDATVFSATADNTADIGDYSIEVTILAKAQSLASNAASAFASVDDTIGSGSMTIQFGSTTTGPYSFTADPAKSPQTIVVSSANDNTTVSTLRDYINDNDYGVQASIVNDGNGYRLLLSSQDSGAANSMEITVSADADGDDNDNSGLSQLAFNASAQTSMLQTVAAKDAALTINGLDISSQSNTIDDAISGVTLDLLRASAGNLVNVAIKENTNEIKASVSAFVEAYNELENNIDALTAYDAESGTASALNGDFTVRTISSQIRNVLFGAVSGLNSNIKSLVDVGITTNSSGTLNFDSSKLTVALRDYPAEVEALFSLQGTTTDSGVRYLSASEDTRTGDYAINITSGATQGVLNGASGVNNLTVDADNDNITLSINGVTTGSLNLTQGVYADAASLAVEIQTQINSSAAILSSSLSVGVSYDGANDRFILTSADYGATSSVEITALDVDSSSDFGLSIGQGVAGIDFSGTIDGKSALVTGSTMTSPGGDSDGLAVEILFPGTTGPLGVASVTRGVAATLDTLLNNFLQPDGFIASREESINESLEDIVDEGLRLDDRIASFEARLIRQFSALDTLVAQFNQTSNFLTQQLANLPKPNSIGSGN